MESLINSNTAHKLPFERLFLIIIFFPVLFRYNWLVALCKLCSIDLTHIYFVEEFFIWTSSLVSQTVKNVPARQIPRLGRSPGEGNGNPLQYSYLENSMNRGAWWAIQSMGLQRIGH